MWEDFVEEEEEEADSPTKEETLKLERLCFLETFD